MVLCGDFQFGIFVSNAIDFYFARDDGPNSPARLDSSG